MRLEDLIFLSEQNTTSGEFDVEVPVQDVDTKVKIKYGHATGPVDDVTISWGNESHNVDFEAEDVIDDHGNEGKDMTFVAYSQDDKWRFIVDVAVGFNYENSGEIYEVHWQTLEIDIDDAKKLPPAVIDRIEYDLKQQWQTEHIEDLEEKVDEILFWCREVDGKLSNKKDK